MLRRMTALPAVSPIRLIAVVSAAQVCAMWGFSTFPALQPTLIDAWSLTNTEAGWINGIFFLAYVFTVPLLAGLTDRQSARHIFLASVVLTGLANLGFALAADGFWSALVLRGAAGVAFSGIYMPGLKLLTDHLEARWPEGEHSRGVSFYTAALGLGAAFSYFIAGQAAEIWNWQAAFAIAGSGAIIAVAIMLIGLPRPDPPVIPPAVGTRISLLPDFRPAFRSRAVIAHVLAYATHSFEVIGFRSWLVSYLVFIAATRDEAGGMDVATAASIAAALSLLAPVSSIAGNEAARRWGRVAIGSAIAAAALGVGVAIGGTAVTDITWVVTAVVALSLFYTILINGDSSVLTAGLVAVAPAGAKGATMAVYSAAGMIGAGLGPLVFGMVLDVVGGGQATAAAWFWAFAINAIVGVSGPLALRLMLKGR